jgi:hypothetical protein
MKRRELEHIIRAAAGTSDLNEIVVIGSQAVLGSFPDAPSELLESMEADVFPKDAPDRSIVIDGAIGEMSLFHSTFGYYAHGVDETTAILPDGWRERLIKVDTNTMGAIGWCLEVHDLAVSKMAAGREKDFVFVEVMAREGLISADIVRERLLHTPRLSSERRDVAEGFISRAWPNHE